MRENNDWWETPASKTSSTSWWKDTCRECQGTGKNQGVVDFNSNKGQCSKCNGEGLV